MAAALSDTLGALLPSLSASESAARARAAETLDKAAKLWPSGQNLSSTSYKTLKTLCRKGIPASMRPSAWLQLSGGLAKKNANPDLYRKLSASTQALQEEVILAIEDDVRKGFNGNALVASSKGAEALNRILFALVQYLCTDRSPQFYYRGLAQVAAVLLIVFEFHREEDAFWTLAALIQDKLFPFSYSDVSFGGKVEQQVLHQLVERKMPAVATHLVRLGLSLSTLTSNWLQLLFVATLPPETTIRVWDAVMSEGSKVALRVALALIKKYEAVIVGVGTPDLVIKVWRLRLSRTFDANELLDVAFNHVGSMSSASISKHRATAISIMTNQSNQAKGLRRSNTDVPSRIPALLPSSSFDGLNNLAT